MVNGLDPAGFPAAEDDALSAELRLALVSGIGPRTRQELLARFGTAQAVFGASTIQLRQVAGVGPSLSRRIRAARHELDVAQERARCQRHGIAILPESTASYPQRLREIIDPPGVLFVLGQLLARDALSIAIVGTRHATQYGRGQAERLSGGLARAGFTVVSGMARGIDAAAHRGALAASGRTIAVLGSGLLQLYPPEHAPLAVEIAARGAVVSEAPPTSPPRSVAFPQRNRLISGLSLAVIVVEAGERSGALITARHALEQGREVFAVPGRIDRRTSRGCHQLIRDGAALVESVDDVLEQLGPLPSVVQREDGQAVCHPAELMLNEQEQKVLGVIAHEPTSVDQLVAASGLPVHRVLSTLSVLEMRHLIRRLSGQYVVRP